MPPRTDHTPRPTSKSAFARDVGRAKSTISEHLKGPLKPALMRSGRVDAAHPVAVAYARSCGVEPPGLAPRPPAATEYAAPPDVDELLELSYRQITDRYGSNVGFADFVAVRKTIADTRRLELANDETNGRLIERELVRHHVFGAIESSNRRLLGDTPRTIVGRVYALAKSGAPHEEAERVVRELISSQLRMVKVTAARVLRGEPAPERKPGDPE